MLEPYAGNLSSTVLRGLGGRKTLRLPDQISEQVFDEALFCRHFGQQGLSRDGAGAMTTRCSICHAPDPLCGLALLGEPLQRILLSAELHLVGRASADNAARYLFIVLANVERNETLHRHRAVERVQEKPTMLQLSPERFDHRVR